MTRMPLEGIKVLDLTMGWAGPLATEIVADFGAEVIKVESCIHLDWWRGSNTVMDQVWERSPNFNAVNQNKQGITLDLTTAKGLDILKQLIRDSDVLIENFAPRVMRNLGLTYPVVSEINPAVIMLSMPAFGLSGPWQNYIGVGSTIEAMSGMAALCGYEGEEPRLQTLAFGDPNSGMNGAIALLMALRHRRRTGEGQHIELAHIDALTPHIGAALMDYVMNRRIPARIGNGSRDYAPHGCYRAKGEDRWVVISVTSDAEWRCLRGILRVAELDDPELDNLQGRLRHRDKIDAAIEAWTETRDRFELAATLQAGGVACGPVLDAQDLASDVHLKEAGFFYEMDRDVVGTHSYPGIPQHLSKTPGSRRTPAPLLGQHNREVLRQKLGLTAAEINNLEEEGIIGTAPVLH